MKRLPFKVRGARPRAGKFETHPETTALLRNLDQVYRRLRQRARAEWLRSHAADDPSDACASVRIACDNSEKFTISGPGCALRG